MITLMNHRETQYHAQKLWEVENIDVDQVAQSMFGQWSIQSQREAAQNLMQWLADTGKEVFQEDLILDYGLDCLRLYLLFEKTPKADDPYLDTWEECSLEGLYKFLGKFRRLILATNEWNQQGGYHDQNVEELLEMALAKGGRDNVTMVLAQISGYEERNPLKRWAERYSTGR